MKHQLTKIKVIDTQGLPMIGAFVFNTSTGTRYLTGKKGKTTIGYENINDVIVIKYKGYKTVKIKVAHLSIITLIDKDDLA